MRRVLIAALLLVCAGAGAVWYRDSGFALGTERAAAAPAPKGRTSSPVSVATVAAQKRDMPIVRRSFGHAEPIAVVGVHSRTDSELMTQNFTEGQFVKQGDLLFTLDDRELQAQLARDQAILIKDQAISARTQSDLTRAQQLLAKNAGTPQAVDQATSDAKSADATVIGDKAAVDADKLRLSYTRITSPIAGRAGSVGITPGNLVHAADTGTPLVTITQIAPIRVSFALPERDFDDVRNAMQQGPVEVRAFPRGMNKPILGRLTFIDSSVDPTTGTITLKGEFDNKEMALWPGEYLDVSVDTSMHRDAVVIPTVAIQQGQDFAYLFVVRPDQTVELRKVTPGASDDTSTEILAGLQPGDEVVVDGQQQLTNGASVRTARTQESREEEAGRHS